MLVIRIQEICRVAHNCVGEKIDEVLRTMNATEMEAREAEGELWRRVQNQEGVWPDRYLAMLELSYAIMRMWDPAALKATAEAFADVHCHNPD